MGFLSINARAPIIRQSEDTFHERLQTDKEQYTMSDTRGFNTAAFELVGSRNYLTTWYANGLLRDITWKGPDSRTCWRGFVSRLSFSIAGITRSKSIEKLGNRIIVVYTIKSTGSNTTGAQATTTVNDTLSQAVYGIKEMVDSPGELPTSRAEIRALSQLARYSNPLIGETQHTANSTDPVLRVEMQGYAYMFDWWHYSAGTTGTANASTVLGTVVASDPNAILTSPARIETNTTATERAWSLQAAWKVIDSIRQSGREVVAGVEGEPWTTGVYEDLALVFKAAEGTDSAGNPKSSNQHLRLYRTLDDKQNRYIDEGGKEVPYWHIRPDRLVYTPGVPGPPLYIETVSYNPPTTLSLGGRDARDPLAFLVR